MIAVIFEVLPHAEHRQAQAAGRDHIFADYRLRVAEVRRDYGLSEREQAPQDSQQVHAHPPQSAPSPALRLAPRGGASQLGAARR